MIGIVETHKQKILYGMVAVLLMAQAALGIYLAKTDSQTTDEAIHLSAGYTYDKYHDFRLNPEHPPLVKMLSAWPLLYQNVHDPVDPSNWQNAQSFFRGNYEASSAYGSAFLYGSGNDAKTLLFYGRLANIGLTLVLGLTLFLIAFSLWGAVAGLVATLLYVLDPTVMAHGHLVTTDMGAALGLVMVMAALWNLLTKKITWKTAVLFGLAVGLAELMKFTMITVYPMTILLVLWWGLLREWTKKQWAHTLAALGLALMMAWVVVIAGYLFQLDSPPASQSLLDSLAKADPTSIIPPLPLVDALYAHLSPILVPKYFIRGLVDVLVHVKKGHGSFLFGHTSYIGWWYYFPAIFMVKTPIPTLITFCMSLFYIIKQRRHKASLAAIFFSLGALLYLLFSMTSKANLGVRHILPIYPLLTLTASYAIVTTWPKLKNLWVTLCAILAIEFVLVCPFYLAYFNQLVGGPYHGYTVATDSNLDWGEDMGRIATYIQKHPAIGIPYVAYNWDGEVALDYYHINRRSLTTINQNRTGYIIIGASQLQGTEYTWVKQYTLVDFVTPGVLVYRLGAP